MAGAVVLLAVRVYRLKIEQKELLDFLSAELMRIDPATRRLVELVTEIANASAQSGDSEYLLAKRLHRILTASRGEGRALKDDFLILTNLYDWGLLSYLDKTYHLTFGDLALCGMLTVGLEPACISKILGYDHERTFYNKRSDIRKKIRLEHTVPLEGYLKDQAERLRTEREAFLRRKNIKH